MKSLRPGEVKILVSLQEGEKRFTDLHKDTDLQYNILSKYLKRLQKLGFVAKDIDTRRYTMVPISLQALFFNDVLDFIKTHLERMVNYGIERAGIIAWPPGWLLVTESSLMMDYFRKAVNAPEIIEAFSKIYGLVEDYWDSHVLSNFKEGKRRTIKTYKRFLLEYLKSVRVPMKEERKALYESLVKRVKDQMASDFPGVSIPQEMVHMQASRRLEQLMELHDEIIWPVNLESLWRNIELLKDMGKYRNDLTEEEFEKLEEMESFLRNPSNQRIYAQYCERLNSTPKALILYPSHGFKGYFQKLKDLLPEEVKETHVRV